MHSGRFEKALLVNQWLRSFMRMKDGHMASAHVNLDACEAGNTTNRDLNFNQVFTNRCLRIIVKIYFRNTIIVLQFFAISGPTPIQIEI